MEAMLCKRCVWRFGMWEGDYVACRKMEADWSCRAEVMCHWKLIFLLLTDERWTNEMSRSNRWRERLDVAHCGLSGTPMKVRFREQTGRHNPYTDENAPHTRIKFLPAP
jgi:hypothetical protein